ncbi:MAG: AMP-binding protein [Acidimicrobiia bacterium]|nr:AMP-binding protein [Acidimicrobiia bacterium]
MGISQRLASAGESIATIRAVARTGLLNPMRPDRFVRMAKGARLWGTSAAAPVAMSAARHPRRIAIIDAAGSVDWATLDGRTNALANALAGRGLGGGDVVGILCRNHRGFVEALVAAAKLGADVVLLNTGFAAPQLAEVVEREGVTALVHDASFDAVVDDAGLGAEMPRFVAWTMGPAASSSTTAPSFDDLAATASTQVPPKPSSTGEVTILSSGTTGTPKGARRSSATEKEGGGDGLASQLGVLTRVPLRCGDPTLVSAPLFHTWGLSGLLTAALMSSPVVLRERFDATDAVAAIDEHRVGTFIAVPVMLQRILELGDEVRAAHDLSTLHVVFLSGSALPGELATRWMDATGDNLYNLYGSTEVAAVTLASPDDLRASPHTAGPMLPGIDVRLLGDDDREVTPGEPGRIFVRSGMVFDGYTGGGSKPVVDGYMGTGDVGRFGDAARLYVEGREDDMVISGGENVVPQEVEDVLLQHTDVVDAAVVGVPDEAFGQRLVAYVVAASGAHPDPDVLRAWVRENLANYKVPRDVVLLDRLPRNPTGKVLPRNLVSGTSDAPAED